MKKILLGILTSTLVISATHAGVVLSDTFSYGDGLLTALAGGIWSAHSSGGSNPILVTNGQIRVQMISASAEDDNTAISGAPYLSSDASAKLYSSYTLILSNSVPNTLGTYISHFRGTNTGAATDFGARVFLLRTNTVSFGAVPDGKFRVSIGNGAAATNVNDFGQVGLDLATNVVYTIVTRFVPPTGLATIWVNPASESDPSATANDLGTAVAPNPFNVFTYAFRQASGGGSIVYVDNLKVGTQFNDVAGANTAPLISSIPDQATPMNTATAPIAFTVQDAETAAASLIVSNSTANPTLVPPGNISLGGAGTNRTITITPATGQQGLATITVYVSDGVNTSSTSFTIGVGAPSISAIPSQIAVTNTPTGAIAFTVSDPEGDSLTLSSNYTNPGLISSVVFGGSGANRTVTVTPAADQQGVSTITVTATDGFNSVSQTFTVTFTPLLGVIFSDDFSYADGSLYGNGSWSFSSGTALEMLVTNGTAQLSRFNTEDLNTGSGFAGGAPFASSSGVVLYSGFTINCEQLPTASGNYFAHFKDTGTGFRAKIFTSTAGAAAGNYRLGIANVANTVNAQVANDLATNTTYLVVSRYNVGTGESALWVNPVSVASGGAVATDNTSTQTVAQYGLREDTSMGVLYLDKLKIGTSLADVATIPSLTQTLTSQLINGELVLSWGSPLFALQSSATVTGPYATIPGATSPYTNTPSASEKFFRLKY